MGRTNRYPDEIRRRVIEEVTKRGRSSSAIARFRRRLASFSRLIMTMYKPGSSLPG